MTAYNAFKNKVQRSKHKNVSGFARALGKTRQSIYNCFLIPQRENGKTGRAIARFMGHRSWPEFIRAHR